MKNYYKFLIYFSQGTLCNKSFMLKHCSPQDINEMLEMGYIYECKQNEYGEPVYAITPKGRKIITS